MTIIFRHNWLLLAGVMLLLTPIFSGNPFDSDFFSCPVFAQGKSKNTSKVEKIFFIDKEVACPCTRNRCDQVFKTLTSALKKASSALTPEKLFIDKDKDRATIMTYRKLKPFDWIPAIYFLGPKGAVLNLLEGEITEADIIKIIKP